MSGPLKIETAPGPPVTFKGRKLIPFHQAIWLSLGRQAGFVWNRPLSILAIEADGRETVIPVPDPTRVILWALLGMVIIVSLIRLISTRIST